MRLASVKGNDVAGIAHRGAGRALASVRATTQRAARTQRTFLCATCTETCLPLAPPPSCPHLGWAMFLWLGL